MDLNRLGDPKYIAELKAARSELLRTPDYIPGRLAFLNKLADEWRAPGASRPAQLEPPHISANEFVAVALAAHRDSEFKQPLAQFLSIQYWLQAWVLERLKLSKHIGRPLGLAGR